MMITRHPVVLRNVAVFSAVVICYCAAARADELMGNDEISALLTDQIVVGTKDGRDWRQNFNRDGTTSYSDGGRPSYGEWRVENDRYCSVWPPSEVWSCWIVERRDPGFAFVHETSGDVWDALVLTKPEK